MFRILFAALLLNSCAESQNIVYTYAGNGKEGFANGDTSTALFKGPFGMCTDNQGNLYIADGGNNCIRKISPSGTVSVLAGTGAAGYADGPALSAQFNSPTGVCADDSGNIYVSDFQNHRIRRISNDNTVTTIAGSGIAGYSDGLSMHARFNYPRGICRDKAGNLYIGDSWNHRIRKISPSGLVTTFAGGGNITGVSTIGSFKDGVDTSARFYTPAGLSVDAGGNIYVADAYNHRIRKITFSGNVTTIAGSGSVGVDKGGFADGPADRAVLNTPTEVFADSAGLYIGDTFNNRIRKVSAQRVVTVAGEGTPGYMNGISSAARFNYPRGLVIKRDKLYICDYNNHSVRVVFMNRPVRK